MDDAKQIVWISHKDDERCETCKAELLRGDFVHLDREKGVRCLKCAGLGGLVYLPSGDPALTRRAAATSPRHAVVLKFSRARKRNERQGVLVEEGALARARESCAQDAERREAVGRKRRVKAEIADEAYRRRFEEKILELFPSCPKDQARAIAEHACRKHSGRVGRTAAAKELDPKMIELAVRARIRHEFTDYDERLLLDGDRGLARAEVRDDIDTVLDRWREPGGA